MPEAGGGPVGDSVRLEAGRDLQGIDGPLAELSVPVHQRLDGIRATTTSGHLAPGTRADTSTSTRIRIRARSRLRPLPRRPLLRPCIPRPGAARCAGAVQFAQAAHRAPSPATTGS